MLVEVSDFISLNDKESLKTLIHHDCLSLVPSSRESLMRNFIDFNPSVNLGLNTENEKLIESFKQKTDLSLGDFKPKEYFLPSLGGDNSNPCSDSKEVIPIETTESIKRKRTKTNHDNQDPVTLWGDTDLSYEEYKPKTEDLLLELRENHLTKRTRKLSISLKNFPLRELTKAEKDWCSSQISLAMKGRKKDEYECKQCFKVLKSATAIRYHLASRHIIKKEARNLDKEWVSQKLKESEIYDDGEKIWKCVLCQKIYLAHPGLRYHLHQHRALKKKEIQEMENCLITKDLKRMKTRTKRD